MDKDIKSVEIQEEPEVITEKLCQRIRTELIQSVSLRNQTFDMKFLLP